MSEKVTSYNTILEESVGEIVEKKSRFIATAIHVESEEEALLHIEGFRKKYWDARHNCYAFILGMGSETMRFSDDGEPSGTAGKPILEVLKGRELTNTLVIVTRYFGGVLLGTGGLVRAYTDSTVEALNNAELKKMCLMKETSISIDYSSVGKLKYILANESIDIIDEQYTDMVTIKTAIEIDKVDSIIKKVTDATSGKATFEEGGELYYPTDLSD
ncbi:MAG: YigZ family protein [Lachnospiraceae bacterium]|nr:YigZ family protein [Candidatus Colinaster scatohippi]